MKTQVTVVFQPSGKRVEVAEDSTVLDAAQLAGLELITPCGGKGTCGRCRVIVASGSTEGGELGKNYVLACQARLKSDVVVEIPAETSDSKAKILERGTQRPLEIMPQTRKYYLELTAPSIEDQEADFDRIAREVNTAILGYVQVDASVLAGIPMILRENDYKVTAVIHRNQLIALEPGDTTKSLYGIAVDVGTTTVAGMLIDLNTSKWLASASRTNPQTKHGDDVVTRIDFSGQKNGLETLSNEIHACLNEIIAEILDHTGLKKDDIYDISVAGNTTMSHLFFKIPCTNIAQAPYIPVFRRGFEVPVRKFGLNIHPEGHVRAIPNIAGFVGADTVAAILASGMHESEQMQLLVDIGTNGEIALGNKDRIMVCSTAAGPAFEGARLTFGMRGTEGAIEKVVINHQLHLDVIGHQKPQGICGSGVIDLLGEMLKAGLVDETGRIVDVDEIPDALPETLRERVISGDSGNEFVLVERESQPPIVFAQRDIREVQLAKAAIFAGIQVLLGLFNMKAEDLDAILLAGAFGNYIRRHQAKQIGLLPNIPEEKIKFIGNAAIEGAMRVLVSQEESEIANKISDTVNYVELSSRQDFQDHYMMAMMFMD